MKLWFNKTTKKFLVTDDNYKRPVKLFMNKIEVTLKELEKSSFNGWCNLELPNRSDVILIPNKHGKSFRKFRVIYYNIEVAKRFINDGDLPVYTQHIYFYYFLEVETMYWILSKYKGNGFPIYFEDIEGTKTSFQLEDTDRDMAIFDYDMANTVRDYVYN